VIAIAVCGVMAGCEGPTSLALWARSKREFLATFLELPAGLPSRDCLRRVLSLLKPGAFQQCFQEWVAACLTANDDADAKTGVQHIATDGKTLRRSHDRGRALGPLHMVSAWASAQGLSLGQLATEEKSNEITAIPHLIEQLDVQGAVVTIDAIGCQTEIARQIVTGGGDYVLAVKDNQPKLCEAIHTFFDEHVQDLARVPHRHCKTLDESHGRRDYRYYSGQRFAAAIRGHWSIENSLHWVLDVVFNEDQSRARERRLADNLSWLRRFAVGLLKRHPGKESIKCKMKRAGWNNDFLTEVLAQQGT
jgi:predicted transposase YbfD/YdcC